MTETAAKQAQRLRAEILSWPDVAFVYGPQLGQPAQYFMRFEMHSGESFYIEIGRESDD